MINKEIFFIFKIVSNVLFKIKILKFLNTNFIYRIINVKISLERCKQNGIHFPRKALSPNLIEFVYLLEIIGTLAIRIKFRLYI